MVEHMFTTFWHIDGVGCTVTFDGDQGDLAMQLGMDLQRQDYPVCVLKEAVGDLRTRETIYESEDWEPPLVYQERQRDTADSTP